MNATGHTTIMGFRGYWVENNIIVSPGKFEQCQEWAPYFWDEALQGFADEDNGQLFRFDVEQMDVARFPALEGIARVFISSRMED